MLNCFHFYEDNSATPLIPLFEHQFQDWLVSQPEKIKNWAKAIGFRAKPGSIGLLCDEDGCLAKVLVGISKTADFTVFGQLASSLPKGNYQIDAPLNADHLYLALLAWGMGSYQFTAYKKLPTIEAKLGLPKESADRSYLEAVLNAIYLVRDLINTPAADMMPIAILDKAKQIALEGEAQITEIVGDDLLAAGYAVIHAVGRASAHPPCLIDLRWGDVHHPKLTLVGKGVCFDSGGLDIKPAAGMSLMKKDMAGAAHVLGLAQIIMALKLPVNLRVLIPAAENAVSGNAYHPGDVLVTRKGITVEVTNTDAEGRLVLCEALHEAATENPDVLIDFATLTGAARVALGTDISALFATDEELVKGLVACGKEESDPLWQLPIYAPYRKLLESKIADITNSASSGYGGAITAAVFLKEFVPDHISWAHFDIMAWNNSSKPGAPEGGEAMALRAVARYLVKRFGNNDQGM